MLLSLSFESLEAVAQRRVLSALDGHAAALRGEPFGFADQLEILADLRGVHGIVGEGRGEADVDKRALDDVDLVERGFVELRPADDPRVGVEVGQVAVDVRALRPRVRFARRDDDVRAAW